MSPRRRNNKRQSNIPDHIDPDKLPAHVYYNPRWHGRWFIRLFNPETKKYDRDIRLGNGKLTQTEIWQAWEEITEQKKDTFRWLPELYLESQDYRELGPTTRQDYQRYHIRICGTKMQSGALLGDKPITWWDRTKVQRYLDKRKSQNAAITGNRETSYMRTVFKWGLNRGHVPNAVGNPAVGPKRNKEIPRSRYVEDWEYQFVLDLARKESSWYTPYVMEIMYLCRCRQIEALSIDRFRHLKKEGLLLERRKGSRTTLTEWSPRLRLAVDGALNDPNRPDISSYVFSSADGRHVRSSTFQTAWQRLMKKALKCGLKNRFTSEDLKPKGTSDTRGTAADKMQATGHKTTTMITRVYDRLPGKSKPVK